jgi:hypothetical protein
VSSVVNLLLPLRLSELETARAPCASTQNARALARPNAQL